jgi:spore coat protein A
LLNIGPDDPFGGGIPGDDFDPADPATTGKVMRFVVNTTLADDGGPLGASPTDPVLANGNPNPNAATNPGSLNMNAEPELGSLTNLDPRRVSLNEASSEKVCVTFLGNGIVRQIRSVQPGPDFEDRCAEAGGEPFGPKEALLGILDSSNNPVPLMWTDEGITKVVTLQSGDTVNVNVTETPDLNSIERWDIYNFTVDAHPIHLHLVRFEVVNREGLETDEEGAAIQPAVLLGNARAPEAWETGYKDTVIAYPGEVTRVKAKFDIAGLYVWHCHIVEHEDNEMMRPYAVGLDTYVPPVGPAVEEEVGIGGVFQ